LKKILDEQKQRLLNKGASGEYNSTIAKLILSANHGMAEKKETVNTHKIEDVPEETKEQIKGILD
jgi:curved DNA-binding protein CbpA